MTITMNHLLGKTISEISEQGETIKFTNGQSVKIYHLQDCCESCGIDNIFGDLQSLIDSPIVAVSEDCEEPEYCKGRTYSDSYTWTNYYFRTQNGNWATIHWLGESNGYYSETPQIVLQDS